MARNKLLLRQIVLYTASCFVLCFLCLFRHILTIADPGPKVNNICAQKLMLFLQRSALQQIQMAHFSIVSFLQQ